MRLAADDKTCRSCGDTTPTGARFCPSCGARLTEHPALTERTSGEYRQITVMFCDLVGSTKLASILDAEDLREIYRAYHRICADEIETRAGMVVNYLGDGVMAFFGYPRAREDAPVLAADASVAITRRMAQLGKKLLTERAIEVACRVGLHTGRVLISEMGSGEHRHPHSVTGMVPNFAARLEAMAPHNSAVVSEQTRALIAEFFHTETLGHYDLKGIDGSVEVFRLVERKIAKFVLPERKQPLFGRDQEISLLADAWSRAQRGERLRAEIIADPGAGKSSLAASFIKQVGINVGDMIVFAGAIAERHTPFAGVLTTLQRDGEVEGLAAASDREHETGHQSPDRSVILATLERRIKTGRPILVILEDTHWIDPSSLELLERVNLESGSGCLTLVLSRPRPTFDWKQPADVRIALSGLNPNSCRQLIEDVAGCKVELSLARRIEASTDGLPLYVEEFTKALIASGVVHEHRGMLRDAQLDTTVQTPATLLDLITSRLDTLGSANSMAQIAAVLGRKFERLALVAVSGVSMSEVDSGLSILLAAGIITSESDDAFTFRHALFQKAAYESLLRAARQRWHRRYVAWLKRDSQRLAATRPETLGFHLEACGRYRQAADKYQEAGMAANRASASLEAAAHFGRARDLFLMAPAHQRKDEDQLHLEVMYAGALLSARGPGAAETRAAYDRALHLAEGLPETEWHLAAYWGWWRVSGTFKTMDVRARRLLQVSDQMEGAEFKLQAMHCTWGNAYSMGDFDRSLQMARKGLELYELGGFEHLRTLYGGHDSKACALGEMGLITWLQGQGDAAANYTRKALAHAEQIKHIGSLVHALDIAVMLDHYRRDGKAVARHGQRLIDLGLEHDLEEYRSKGEIFLGWSEIDGGSLEQGLERIDASFRIMKEICTPEDFPVYQSMRAEALCRLGRPEAALEALNENDDVIIGQGVTFWAAEIARQQAAAELARKRPDLDFVQRKIAEGRRIAERQGALALTLRLDRVGLDLARVTGEIDSAREALGRTIARFPETARGRDLDEARKASVEPA